MMTHLFLALTLLTLLVDDQSVFLDPSALDGKTRRQG
jgi:hypothetical protein